MTVSGTVDWLGGHAPSDTSMLDSAPGGALSESGRQAAVESSLQLLGMYFGSGDQTLEDRAAIGTTTADPVLDELHAGLRLRVAISAGHRLGSILDAVARRATFRYELHSTSHVGSLNGALDVTRWVTRPRGGDQDTTFPVLEVRRGAKTPENILAVYAAQWLSRELRLSLAASAATVDAAEYRVVRQLRGRLERALSLPALADCLTEATAIRTSAAVRRLITQVHARLVRREIANTAPYRELAGWVEACLSSRPLSKLAMSSCQCTAIDSTTSYSSCGAWARSRGRWPTDSIFPNR